MSQIIGDMIIADPVNLIIQLPAAVNLIAAGPAPVNLVVTPPAALLVTTGGQGPAGPQGTQGPAGPAGGASLVVNQAVASSTWLITHGLQRYPSITTVDSAGDQIFGDLVYLDNNNARISFGAPVAGSAYLN